jgi:EAL domain-containing protein (putative c-di-GMP-specific phosphodiesterase class I)
MEPSFRAVKRFSESRLLLQHGTHSIPPHLSVPDCQREAIPSGQEPDLWQAGCPNRLRDPLVSPCSTLETVPDAIDSMLAAAAQVGVSARSLILEVTEGEVIHDTQRLAEQLNRYRAQGLRLAIDDFGAGYAGLNLLADFQPDVVKLDMALVRGIDTHGPRQAIARAVIQVCDDLGIEVIAEGIETEQEYRWFKRIGVRHYQGFLFGRPAFEAMSASAESQRWMLPH